MTPLVLIPGMMCDARLFAPQIDAFSESYKVVVILPTADTVAGMAAQVLENVSGNFALAGLSLGGIVAMEVFAQAPERVTRLALMDTNPKAETDQIKARRGPQIDRVRAGHLHKVMRDEMKPHYLSDGPDRDRVLDLCMDMAEGLGTEIFINQSKALRDRPDQQDVLSKVTQPTLILSGEDDRLCPPDRHHLMKSLIPHATLTFIEGAGHLPTLEQPKATTNALKTWLNSDVTP